MSTRNVKETTLVFFVNGKKIVDNNVEPEWTLLHYLRNKLRLCGTKLGCGEGGCGACTVMVSRYDRLKGKVIHLPVNACLAPICSMHGLAVTTVEGIGSTKTKLHPVQERIAKAHGSQCGFCTPGIVMSMYTLLRTLKKPSMKDIEVALQGNLCRCTGYRPIIEGYKTFTEEWEIIQNGNSLISNIKNGQCPMGNECCKLKNGVKHTEEVLFEPSDFVPYDASQEPIFPPELSLCDEYDKQFLIIKGKTLIWYRPTKLAQLLQLKKKYPAAKIVVGNTEVGVEVKFKQMVYPVIIQPNQIPEMIQITSTKDGVRIGASTTLNDLEKYLSGMIPKIPEFKSRIFSQILEMLNWFAGKQIRSVGAIGSNIMTGSPISDIIPILMANKVVLELQSVDGGIRNVKLDNDFFTGYRRTILKADELLLAIHIPYTEEDQYFFAFKQARRREDDIAIVNAAVKVTFQSRSSIIQDIGLAFGGMSFKTVMAPNTEKKLIGLPWNRHTLEIAYDSLIEDLPLDPGAPGGMINYRRSLTLSLFYKAFLAISASRQNIVPNLTLKNRELSGIYGVQNKEYKSSQYFTVRSEDNIKNDFVHRPVVHRSAFKQATGEAVYLDDMPFFENELFLSFVTSTRAHANIVSIDPSVALRIPGVHYFLSAKDLTESQNCIGSIVFDEKVFYGDKVTSQGQIIGAIIAQDQAIAQKAARKVKVEYRDLLPVILTIDDAIKHNSYFANPFKVLVKGDVDEVIRNASHVIEGRCQMGGQEHFYLETNCCIVVPKGEDDEIEIFSSTQNPSEITSIISKVLDIPQHKVVTKVKRLGGGFGGKQSKAMLIAVPAALAAVKLNRPIRCVLDRDEDMLITSARHPFMIEYKAGVDHDGRILGIDVKVYNNCGYSEDLSSCVLEKAVMQFDSAYKIPSIRIAGIMCKTNLPSFTAFRGFGTPQGIFGCQSMIADIAAHLNKDPVEICLINLYQEGDLTPYNQKLIDCTLQRCWDECMKSSNYQDRRKSADKFNNENKYKKRGLSFVPTKFGIAFEVMFMNQAGALVLVYTDGSVLLTHGGVEMGQGLNTKMIQIAAHVFDIPIEKVHMVETATDKVPNTSPTAASTGSDLNGMAVLDACNTIKERLLPYKEANPKGRWEDWVKKAYFDRVSLSATGFYKTPFEGYNWDTGKGEMFNYFTYGVACSEVEIDTLTGDHNILRVDIVMDLGESLNPAIDIGQIEGAFMQGYGLHTLEELVFSPMGTLHTRGPGTYKIPGLGDIPGEFNVSLLKETSNPRAIYSSKAVGEPPLNLGNSVFFAIKNAISAARQENGIYGNFKFDSPATSARIRMACQDNITEKFKEPQPGTFMPWNVYV